jgi:hypothetical protein
MSFSTAAAQAAHRSTRLIDGSGRTNRGAVEGDAHIERATSSVRGGIRSELTRTTLTRTVGL